MRKERLNNRYFVVFLCASVLTSCAPSLEEPSRKYEEALGPGWTCHLTPDEFKRAGVVVELTSDGKYFFYQDISDRYERITGEFSLPSIRYSYKLNIGGLENLFKGLGIEKFLLPINPKVGTSYTANTTYGGASKTSLTGGAASDAIEHLRAELNASSSSFYLIRESVAVRSADVSIYQDQSIQIGSSQANSAQNLNNEITSTKKEFERPLGICTNSQLISVKQTGESAAVVGSDEAGLPKNLVIQPRSE